MRKGDFLTSFPKNFINNENESGKAEKQKAQCTKSFNKKPFYKQMIHQKACDLHDTGTKAFCGADAAVC